MIDTLVSDIYGLFDKDYIPVEEVVATFGEKLAKKVAARVSEERVGGGLRLSNLGTLCRRQLYYKVKTPELSEPLPPDVRMKFLIGDILEETLLYLAKEAGHDVQCEQDEVELHGVKGHIDAVIDGMVVDTKSASSMSFLKFQDGLTEERDSFGYLTQLRSYVEAKKDDDRVKYKDTGAFFVIDKTLGKICLDIHRFFPYNSEKFVADRKKLLADFVPPLRDYEPEDEGKSGNKKLGTYCSYCSFKKECYPALRAFDYSKGPVYLTKVARPPLVPELSLE